MPLLLLLLAALPWSTVSPARPFMRTPLVPAPAHRRVSQAHDTTAVDSLRWLEAVNDPRVRAWMRAQDSATRRSLAHDARRPATRAAIAAPAAVPAYGAPLIAGPFQYIPVFPAIGPTSGITLLVRDSLTGSIDTLVRGTAGGASNDDMVRRAFPSPDGAIVALAVADGTTEWETIRLRRRDGRGGLRDAVPGLYRYSGLAWSHRAAARGFYYTKFAYPPGGRAAGRPVKSGAVYFHALGTASGADRLVYEPTDQALVTPTPYTSEDGRWLVITVRRGTARSSRVVAFDLARQGAAPRVIVSPDSANHVLMGVHGTEAWFVTDSGAPRGRVVAVDLSNPSRRRTVVPEGPDAIDTWNFGAVIGGRLVVLYRRDARLVGAIFTFDGTRTTEVAIPENGSVWSGITGSAVRGDAWFTVQGVADPGSVYRLDVRTGAVQPQLRPRLPYDPSILVTSQEFFTARDGTRIPMYVVRRKDVPLDGRAPAWIYGYGAQRWTAAPWFQPNIAAFLQGGGVWAVPNIRGGAEYGERWFTAGSRRNKQVGIDDYIAAASHLVARGFTARGRIVAHGTSAGGVLVAAAAVQQPDLFGAVVLEYAMLDLLRYEHLLTGDRWSDDYGTIADVGDRQAMLAYAPIQRLQRGACYPATFVAPGEFDQTAAPAHSYKFVAALQAAQGCPRPVRLRVSWGAGHQSGATVDDAIDNWADQLAFVASQLPPAMP